MSGMESTLLNLNLSYPFKDSDTEGPESLLFNQPVSSWIWIYECNQPKKKNCFFFSLKSKCRWFSFFIKHSVLCKAAVNCELANTEPFPRGNSSIEARDTSVHTSPSADQFTNSLYIHSLNIWAQGCPGNQHEHHACFHRAYKEVEKDDKTVTMKCIWG